MTKVSKKNKPVENSKQGDGTQGERAVDMASLEIRCFRIRERIDAGERDIAMLRKIYEQEYSKLVALRKEKKAETT